MFADLRTLRNENTEVVTPVRAKAPKLKIAALTRKDCEAVPALAKYFVVNYKELDRFHIPEITAEQYEELAKEFKKTARFDERNLKFATASDYYIRKARVMAVAKDLGVSPSFIDTTDYIWDERMYTEYSFWHNVDVVDDAWREEGEDLRYANSWKVYIGMDAKSAMLDTDLYDTLYKLCFASIIHRKAMLLCKIDKCLSFLQSVVEYTYGFKENITASQKYTLEGYLTFFTDLLNDEDFSKFISKNNDVTVFADNESTHRDYIETYRSMIRSLVRCSGEELEFFRTEMSIAEDPYIEEILAKEIDPEDCLSGTYLENEEDTELEVDVEC